MMYHTGIPPCPLLLLELPRHGACADVRRLGWLLELVFTDGVYTEAHGLVAVARKADDFRERRIVVNGPCGVGVAVPAAVSIKDVELIDGAVHVSELELLLSTEHES